MAFIIDDILSLPVKGLIGIFKEIRDYADRELNDINYWQHKLLELQLRHEMGEIEEQEFKLQEKEIVHRISEIQERG
mgnify:CR=1 FL=1